MAMNKAWVKIKNRSSSDYVKGVDDFLDFALSNVLEEERETTTIRCPCNRCRNIFLKRKCDVRLDLLKWGIYEKYTLWEFHGEISEDTSIEEDGEFDDDEADGDDEFTMLQDACGVDGMKSVVVSSGDSMTQEQISIDVLGSRSRYIRGKGTALRGYTKGLKQLPQQKIVEQQQELLQEQKQKIQDLKKMMEKHKAEQQRAMEAFKQELLQTLAIRNV